jgi:hypothetical protein
LVFCPFEDGAKGLVENCLHNYLRICLAVIVEHDIFETDASGPVVLLQAVSLCCQIGNNFVFSGYLLLKGDVFGIRILQELFQGCPFCWEGLESIEILNNDLQLQVGVRNVSDCCGGVSYGSRFEVAVPC